MKEPEHLWFLLGVEPQEMKLWLCAMGGSSTNPELATEHEPRALAVLKKHLAESGGINEVPKELAFHACRLTLDGDEPANVYKERKRWTGEFRRFLARCGLTQIEQKDMINAFAAELLSLVREKADAEAGVKPLSESLWGKKGKVKVRD